MSTESAREALLKKWERLLDEDAKTTHPFYAELCAAASDHPLFVDLLLSAPPEQQRPNLLLAAVHYLCLQDDSGQLAPWYPSQRWFASLHASLDAQTDDTANIDLEVPSGGTAAFSAFLKTHSDELTALIATRSTQTNEIGRSGPLLYGLSQCNITSQPVALIDLGASAGLNLFPERNRLELSSGEMYGDPRSDVIVRMQTPSTLPPLRLPPIRWRGGLDLTPLDPTNDDDALWLLACQWPDDVWRFERSRLAIRRARQERLSGLVRQGDVIDDLPELLAVVPVDHHVIVFHSWMAAYLSQDRQTELAELLAHEAKKRPISWLWLEHPREVPGLSPPCLASERRRGSSFLVLKEEGHSRVLAQCHPHGTWLDPVPS